jgi:hypothetical protein
MRHRFVALASRVGWAAALGVVSILFSAASPAAAQNACQNSSGQPMVRLLGTGTSNSIMMAQTDGEYFEGDILVRVYCGVGGALIPNATVTFSTTVPGDMIFLNGVWTPLNGPVSVSIPSGEQTIKIKTKDPNLLGSNWEAFVGTNTVTVTGAFGQTLPANQYPTATGMIWAQTPELGSLALFGAGAAGMAGYALTRVRAGFGRRGRRE